MPRLPSPRTFTLLELLLVVFILAALAATAASLGTQVDQQARYDDTLVRRERIRAAILGDPARTVNGQPVVSGFVADMGRLPRSLRELVERGAQPAWQVYSADAQAGGASGASQGAGWRGPYLPASLERDPGVGEVPVYRDGWANGPTPPDPNFGWTYLTSVNALGLAEASLTSLGADGAEDLAGTDYATAFSYRWDQPTRAAAQTLVSSLDYTVDLSALSFTIHRVAATVPSRVALQVLVPSTSDPDALTWPVALSDDLSGVPAAAGSDGPPVSPAGLPPIPWGRRGLVLVDPDTDPPTPLGPVVGVTLLPRTSPPTLVLELR